MVKMMITVVLIYAVCWLPMHTITLVGDTHPDIWTYRYTRAYNTLYLQSLQRYNRQASPYGRIQKCGLGGVKWRRQRRRRGVGFVPLPRKILACSSSQWCILVHSEERFRPNIIATMMFMTPAEV